MADVNLSVAVTTTGTAAAIANMESLRKASQNTAAGLGGLARASSATMAAVTRAAGATNIQSNKMTGYGNAVRQASQSTAEFNKVLGQQSRLYSAQAKLDPLSTPATRLARLGGSGGIQAGLATAALAASARAARGATMEGDANKYLAEQQALRARATARVIAATNQLNAKQNVSRAREDLKAELDGLNAVQRATTNLVRAKQDLARAEAARKATGIGTTDVGRTAALNAEAAAVRQLTQAQAQLTAAKARHNDDDNAFQSSYSYFMIAGLATGAATAILAVGAAAITATAQIERSFVDVERTFDGTSFQLASLKAKLTELSTSTPNSLVDLSQIAALGNQLGVAATDIESFTQTVAQYSTISGVSAEETATAFGKIGNLTGLAASQYSNLASSISYVARTSAATESTIQNTAKEITALSSGAGFSAASIVGLAGALSSLAIPPERARGALSLYFGALNSAVAEGGPKLDAFATLTGKTADEIGRLVRDGKGEEVFTSFISGLAELDTVAKTTALDELGLSTIRVDQTMRALAQNVPLLTKSLAGANTAFTQNTELGRQYAMVQETLATKMAEFKNAVTNAAGAVGLNMAGALSKLLQVTTSVLVAFGAFAATDFGQKLLKSAAVIGIIVGSLAALIGVLALGKASLVVFAFAMRGLGWGAATTGLRGLIANLFLSGAAARASAFNFTSLKVALAESTIRARAAAFAMGALKFAMVGIGIGLLIEGWNQLDQAMNRSKYAADGLGGSTEELVTAMKADNTKLFADAVSETGEKSSGAVEGVQSLNESVRAGIEAQQEMRDAAGQVNGKVDEQAIKVGKATQAWIRSAVLQSDAMQDILNNAQLSADLQAMMDAGFDLGKYSDLAYTKGADEAEAYRRGWAEKLGPGKAVGRGRYAGLNDDDPVGSAIGANNRVGKDISNIGTGLEERKRQSVLMDAISGTTGEIVDGTAAVDSYGRAMLDANGNALILSSGMLGAKNSVEEYRGSLQDGLKDFVDFKNILDKVEEAQNEANKRDEGPAGTDTSLINATEFGKQLDLANGEATTFFNGISTLAANGRSSFATQLAGLGPDAQGILASATALGPDGQAKLEEGARLAGFLASTAFQNAMKAEMANSNDAYATIFKKTGNLADVQSYIAAQVAGTGAAWEAAWAAENPDLPLNVDLINPTREEINTALRLTDGSLTVAADVVTTFTGPNSNTVRQEAVKVITDAVTGNTITVPATLDGPALTTALSVWDQNQKASPKSIAAKLNTPGLSAGLDTWRANNGNVTIGVTFRANNSVSGLIGGAARAAVAGLTDKNGRPINAGRFANGGKIPAYATGGKIKDGLPAFAGGGSWGQFKGPGSGTSDSLIARVSAGEYINTAKSTNFWGPDFFDSLNRNMLPTSFLNMLGAAASGGNGPSSVTNVNVNQINPLTRDPLKQLREDSEMVASGIWG